MPFITIVKSDDGAVYRMLFRRKLKKGDVLETDGLAGNFKVMEVHYVDTRGRDFSVTTPRRTA